jgi:translation initiation factor 2B subunit (eIF-2B alpha/beta/delta family)
VAALSETVEELRSHRTHGGSWMARRAVEALLEVASEPASTTDTTSPELVSEIVTEEGPVVPADVNLVIGRTPFLRDGYRLLMP